MLGIVVISGCTSSDNTQPSVNDTNSSYSTTTSEPATTSSVNTTSDTNSSSSDYPSSDYSSSSDSSSSSSASSSDSGAYIANANTGVFHYASCYHVDAMKDSNKVYYSSATAAENAGYRPCKDCNP